MKRFRFAVVPGVLLATLALSPLPSSGQPRGQIVAALDSDRETLDPHQATGTIDYMVLMHVFDHLIARNPETMKLVGGLAESWKAVDDLTWEFRIRKGVKFHNGEPFNAEAAKFTIDRLITKGVHQVYGGFATIERAEVVDPYTINVVTSKPDPILVKRFAGYGGQMLPPQYLKQVDWKDFALKPVGTGPYKFVEWVKDDRVVLEANDAYWRGAPKIKKVVWRPIPDNFARVAALTRGEAQLITKVIPDHVAQIEKAIEHWQEPDRGIWEVRGEPRHFTSSKMFCWVALDRGARLAGGRGEDALQEKWRAVADEIHADICANGVDERGVFTQFYGTDALDASLLLMPLVRFLPQDDERVRATVLAIADELTMDGLVLRYRVEQTDDGLSGEEGTFTICSFWLVSALVEIGELPRARALCEKVLSFASPLQLYAEEIDPVTGRHLGNFPQAFTHLALINAVVHLIQAEMQTQRGFSMAHQIVT